MYFSSEQIAVSIDRLSELSPFFGTVFLAFEKQQLPVGTTKQINFARIIEDMLQTYYRAINNYPGFYTPFKTTNSNRWNTRNYAAALHQIANDTFSEAFIHPKRHNWGWHQDYINILKEKYLRGETIPAFDLAVWLFRTRNLPTDTQPSDIIEDLLSEFNIGEEALALFDISIPPLANLWLRNEPIASDTLLDIIGAPPGGIAAEGATLELLKLTGVGPTKQLECNFSSRLNLITGDNSLGKTFLLECAWWALTGEWAREAYPAQPRRDVPKNSPTLAFQIGKENRANHLQTVRYDWNRLKWNNPSKRDVLPGLSIFAQLDGSFAVWDPAKHLLLDERRRDEEGSEALIRFTRDEVWDGKNSNYANRTIPLCNGLIRDWTIWQTSDTTRFSAFESVLQALAPHPTEEPLIPGEPQKLPPDSRQIPTLRFPYGEVPIVLCSAGIQRILALAYLLVWTWYEHLDTSRTMRKEPQRSIVLLIDEMEAHLHPFWQRVITPALMDVVNILSKEIQTQLIIATHSPLVLASVEDRFARERDSLFHLYLENGEVRLDSIPFIKRGRVDLWLMSDLFGLKQARSKIAEDTIEAAKRLQQKQEPSQEEVRRISDRLTRVLAPDDEFWPRWTYFAEQRGVVL